MCMSTSRSEIVPPPHLGAADAQVTGFRREALGEGDLLTPCLPRPDGDAGSARPKVSLTEEGIAMTFRLAVRTVLIAAAALALALAAAVTSDAAHDLGKLASWQEPQSSYFSAATLSPDTWGGPR